MKNDFEKYPTLLSTNEVAIILGVTCKTVRNLVNKGKIHSTKVGRLIRIPEDKLLDYIERK